MKKTVLLLIVFSALINSVHAQTSGGPDAYGYIWRTNLDAQGPAYNWIDLTSNPEAVQVTGLGDDNFVGPFSLVAPFHYYWYDINSFYIGSTGYLAVNGGLIASSASGFPTIPSSSGVNNYIGAFVTDFTFAGPGNIGQCYYYQSADSDSLIVSWVNVPFWQQPAPTWTGSNSYQIILNRLDSSIVMQYETQNGVSSALGNTIEIGIENNSGAVGLEYLSSTYPSVTTAVKYIYPTTTLFQVNDASTSFCDNPSNGGIFLIKNGASFTMGAGFKNTGNTNLATFNVSAEVQDAATNIVVRDTQTIASLNTNAFQFVAFADPFIPDTEGVFSMNCFTLLPADATPTNDLRTLEINVVDASQTNIELSYDEGNSVSFVMCMSCVLILFSSSV